MEPIKLYLALDDLYDTRFSLMASISVHRAVDAVKNGYGTRLSDHVIWQSLGITEEQWLARYRKRDDEILVHSVRTKMYNLLLQLFQAADQNPRDDPNTPNLDITINEYPYALSKEVQDAQRDVVRTFLPGNTPVRFIRRNPKQLTPKFIADNFTHVVFYDFATWCLLHEQTQEPGNILPVEFILPAILKELPSIEDGVKYKDLIEKVGITGMLEQGLSPVLTLRFIEIDHWNTPN